jgi:hypothetical protein
MPAHNNGGRDAVAEKIIVRRVLENHTEPVARSELYAARPDIGAERFDTAILSLTEAQILTAEVDSSVRSAPALQRLDDLNFIAI